MIRRCETPRKYELSCLYSFRKQVYNLLNDLLPWFPPQRRNSSWARTASGLVVDEVLQAFFNSVGAVERVLRSEHSASITHRASEKLEGKSEPFTEQVHPVRFLEILVRKEVGRSVISRCFEDRFVTFIPGGHGSTLYGKELGCLRNCVRRKRPNILSWLADWFVPEQVLLNL